jgi:O-antigen ligase
MTAPRFNLRLILICWMAFSVALPIAVISLSKLLLLLFVLAALAIGGKRYISMAWESSHTSRAVLMAMIALTASLAWTSTASSDAFNALGKHGKLLLIPIMVGMLKTRRESLQALACFGLGQLLLLLSSWLLFAGVDLPWAISREHAALGTNAVFSSYLDQSIMTAVAAAICWQLRSYIPTPYRQPTALLVLISGMFCVFFVFKGRTGHLLALAMIALILMRELPGRFRWLAVVIVPLLLLILALGNNKVSERLQESISETLAYSERGDTTTSSGTRLNLWHRSLQAIAERPVAGHGVGSWEAQYNIQEKKSVPEHQPIKGNPHQEYLLWAVEMGIIGLLFFSGLLFSIYKDSTRMPMIERQALLSALFALALACLVNCSLYDALIGDYFCVVIALLLALGLKTESEPSSPPSPLSRPTGSAP